MNTASRITPRRIAATGLVAGAVGITILYIAGTEMPVVPPGLVLLVGAAIAVTLSNRRWAAIVATLVALSEIAGIFASGSGSALLDPSAFTTFAGTWIRLVGVCVASVAGVVAIGRPGRPSDAATRPVEGLRSQSRDRP